MSAVITGSPARSRTAGQRVARPLWLVLAVFWTAFAILEGVNHGGAGWGAALAGLIAPDLTFLIGARGAAALERGRLSPAAVPYYNLMHRMTVPLVIAVLYSVGPWHLPALFAALCGWMAHIAWDRVFGFGLRDREGWQRG